MQELWEIRSILLLTSFQDRHLPEVVAPDKGPIYGSNKTKLCTYAKLNYLK